MVRREPKNLLGDCSKCVYVRAPFPVEGSCGRKNFECSCEDYEGHEIHYAVILLKER